MASFVLTHMTPTARGRAAVLQRSPGDHPALPSIRPPWAVAPVSGAGAPSILSCWNRKSGRIFSFRRSAAAAIVLVNARLSERSLARTLLAALCARPPLRCLWCGADAGRSGPLGQLYQGPSMSPAPEIRRERLRRNCSSAAGHGGAGWEAQRLDFASTREGEERVSSTR